MIDQGVQVQTCEDVNSAEVSAVGTMKTCTLNFYYICRKRSICLDGSAQTVGFEANPEKTLLKRDFSLLGQK